jgi:hypothetical protein
MIASDANDRLIETLAADLIPMRRLAPPRLRALVWLAFVGAIAMALTMTCDIESMLHRFVAAPDLCIAALGSMLTAVLAAVAAFQLSLPDRKPFWALLPVPALVLWVSASGIGCLRSWAVAQIYPIPVGGTDHCLLFILALSTPLSVFLVLMLRRGCSLQPALTSVVGGLACASAAATLLNFIHLHAASAPDMAVHAFAVGAVVLGNGIFGSFFLTGKKVDPVVTTRSSDRTLQR